MASFTIKTQPQAIFGKYSSYWLIGNLETSSNPQTKTCTITLKSVHSDVNDNTTYDFGQEIHVGFGNTYAEAKKDAQNSKGVFIERGYIKASGSIKYRGRLPEKGEAPINEGKGYSKSFTYGSNGKKPTIYCYLQAYKYHVMKLSTGEWVTADTHTVASGVGTGLIDPKNIPDLDLSAPKIEASASIETFTKITAKAQVTNGKTVDLWQSKLDSANYAQSSANPSYTVKNGGTHKIYIKARNKVNGIYSDPVVVNFNCNKPTITQYNNQPFLTPTSKNKATLNFTVTNFNYDYKLESGDWINKINKNASPNVSITVGENKKGTYTFKVRRADNTDKSFEVNKTVNYNTIVPNVKIENVQIAGNSVTFDVTSTISTKDWKISISPNSGTSIIKPTPTSNVKKISVRVDGLTLGTVYTVTAEAKNPDNNLWGKTSKGDIKAVGLGYIFTDPTTKVPASVYIYKNDKEKWVPAIPYIYDGTEWIETIV